MATKYPIILVHGIILKDFLFFKAFGRIEEILRKEGHTVYTAKIDGFGTTANNAKQLYQEITEILNETGCEKINIIAHSKGGLDSKHMIRNFHMEKQIASLTTLCTPHKGSRIATNILRLPKPMLSVTNVWLNTWYRIFGDKHPDALTVCKELAYVESIEEETAHLSEEIYCQSFSTTLENSRDDFIMGIPLMFSHYFENSKSDGLVAIESAVFGNYRGPCVDASISHSEIVDFMVKAKKRDQIYGFYTVLCDELEQMGY